MKISLFPPVRAATEITPIDTEGPYAYGAPELQQIAVVFSNLLVAIIPLIGLLSFIMIIVGGVTILTSAGNAENVKKGQMTITFSVGGIILAILAWLILLTIKNLTGVDVTLFRFGF